MQTCDLCHEPADGFHFWRDLSVCFECQAQGEFYDSMTPEERRRDDEAQARYVELHREDF